MRTHQYTSLLVAILALAVTEFQAFTPICPRQAKAPTLLYSAPVKDETKTETPTPPDPEDDSDPPEGLPWWWEFVWKLDVMQKGEDGAEMTFGDTANVLRTNIEQIYGGYPSLDGCPLAEGELSDIADGTMFVGLQSYFQKFGSPYKVRLKMRRRRDIRTSAHVVLCSVALLWTQIVPCNIRSSSSSSCVKGRQFEL